MADVKDLLKMIASPVLVAGAAGFGGRWANNKYKLGLNPWVAGIGGAAIGYIIGKGVQSWLTPKAEPAPAPALPEQQQAQLQGPPRHLELRFNQNAARQLPAPTPDDYAQSQYVPAAQTLAPIPEAGPPELDEPPDGIFMGAGFADFEDDSGNGVN